MKSFRILTASVLVLFGLGLTAGCGPVYDGGVEGPGEVPVYGGYDGPWNNGYVEYGGAGYYRPPFHADDHGGGGARPAEHGGPPSIPNHARSGGGGGGGHMGGGGGGGGHASPPSGGSKR